MSVELVPVGEKRPFELYDPYADAVERGVRVGFLPITTAHALWVPEKNVLVISDSIESEEIRRCVLAHMLGHMDADQDRLGRKFRAGLVDEEAFERKIRGRVIRRLVPTPILREALVGGGQYAEDVAETLGLPLNALAERVRAMTAAERYALDVYTKRLLWPRQEPAPTLVCGFSEVRKHPMGVFLGAMVAGMTAGLGMSETPIS